MSTRSTSLSIFSIFLAIGSALLAGCPKSGGDPSGGPAPSASASGGAPRGADSESGAPATSAASPAGQASTWTGTYSVAPAKYYISETKEFASVKQAKDDPSKNVGDGTLTLAVDPTGRVSGTIDTGPASPAIIEGRADTAKGEILGNVRRKDTADDGLTGTLEARIEGDAVAGKLSLAEATATIVREGKLTLKKK